MIEAGLLAGGIFIGAFGVWWAYRGQLEYLRTELRTAQDRLLHAWDKGATIPPRPPEPLPPPQPLPELLQEYVDQWDSEESRRIQEQEIRRKMEAGMKPIHIARDLENSHP